MIEYLGIGLGGFFAAPRVAQDFRDAMARKFHCRSVL